MNEITAAERVRHVQQANANSAIEGFQPDKSDQQIQARYIEGTATIQDLFDHAQAFVESIRVGSHGYVCR